MGHLICGVFCALNGRGKPAVVELFQAGDPVLISVVKAALAEAGIPAVEFDGPVADLYGAMFPRRIMVLADDLAAARAILREISPETLA